MNKNEQNNIEVEPEQRMKPVGKKSSINVSSGLDLGEGAALLKNKFAPNKRWQLDNI